jgi:hypothetical protein
MAKTKIRRKSLSNKKRRSNKKKSVRRMKKGGDDEEICKEAIRHCTLAKNTEKNVIINLKALDTFVGSHPNCNIFESGKKDDDFEQIHIKKDELLKQINEIKEERERGYYKKANKLTLELVEKIPSIHAKEVCSISP